MTVILILHCVDREETLFDGPAANCPPVPDIGSQIKCGDQIYRLEAIRHVYTEGVVTIHLMA